MLLIFFFKEEIMGIDSKDLRLELMHIYTTSGIPLLVCAPRHIMVDHMIRLYGMDGLMAIRYLGGAR